MKKEKIGKKSGFKMQARTKRAYTALFCAFLLLCMCACANSSSAYERSVEDDCFTLSCSLLNTTVSEPFTLYTGDQIELTQTVSQGQMTFCVGIAGEEPLYTGNGSAPARSVLTVPADGTYLLSVSGEQAVGEVCFRIYRVR